MALSVTNITKIETSAGASVSGAIADMAANALMVCVMSDFGGALANMQASDSENGGNYSTIIERGTPLGDEIGLLYTQNSVAGAASSGNCSGGVGTAGIVGIFYEVAGASTSAAFVGGEAGGSTGSISSNSTCGSATITASVANSIIFAGFTTDEAGTLAWTINNSSGTLGTYTQNTSSGREFNANSFPALGSVYQIVASSGSQKHVWTTDANLTSTAYATVIAAFGQSAGGGAVAMLHRRSLMGVGL